MQHITTRAASIPESNFNCVAIRRDQFGLGKAEGKTKHVPSLICALVKRSHPTWVGRMLLEASNGQLVWWVCAIKNGRIYADGDAVFLSKEEAEKRLQEHKSFFDWPTDATLEAELIAEGKLPYEVLTETVEETREQLSGLIKPAEKLRPLEQRSLHPIFYWLLLILLCGAGFKAYEEYHSEQLRKAARAQRLALEQTAEKTLAEIRNAPEQFFNRYWQSQPQAKKAALLCISSIKGLPLYSNGWELSAVTCTNAGTSWNLLSEWQYSPAASFTRLPSVSDSVRLGKDPKKAFASSRLTLAAERPPAALITKADARSRLFQLAAAAEAVASLSWSPPEVHVEKPVLGKPVTFPAPWQKADWTLTRVPFSALAPDALPEQLNAIPGVVISSVSYSRNQWKLSGEIYAVR
ncbi:type 4b pilus protein PilO2 [Halodesulfovibrio sp.]|uniref:type 4b pilus protein PilO2 n=1 Tax=Halodesulfovibrio sp. TaxID=1912772 RepID=UPI0025DD3EC7|nr:type 4b pilus protein PilO2 [Halodesulfovibrio sp.]MCT4625658.1 type 4b pilus protein PilO2 [Halodesulfovibrio sp.]